MPRGRVDERATATTTMILIDFGEATPETPHRWQARLMAFKLTYSDGQETDYDDDTAWEVDDGVLKMGRRDGEWSVLVSPSHWAVLEVGGQRQKDDGDGAGDSPDQTDESESTAEKNADDDSKEEDDDKD